MNCDSVAANALRRPLRCGGRRESGTRRVSLVDGTGASAAPRRTDRNPRLSALPATANVPTPLDAAKTRGRCEIVPDGRAAYPTHQTATVAPDETLGCLAPLAARPPTILPLRDARCGSRCLRRRAYRLLRSPGEGVRLAFVPEAGFLARRSTHSMARGPAAYSPVGLSTSEPLSCRGGWQRAFGSWCGAAMHRTALDDLDAALDLRMRRTGARAHCTTRHRRCPASQAWTFSPAGDAWLGGDRRST